MTGQAIQGRAAIDPSRFKAPLRPGAGKRFAQDYVDIIPLLPQRQDSLTDQLDTLYIVSMRLGLWDASDWMRGHLEAERV